jgi:aldehyde:ferredoxin oxidoreductase
MARGYMGKLLFVNLSTGEMREEPLDETSAVISSAAAG